MEQRKVYFRKTFRNYIDKGNAAYVSYSPKSLISNLKDFLFPEKGWTSRIEFVNAFLWYLDRGYPDSKKGIISALKGLAKKDPSSTYHFCVSLIYLLDTDKDEAFSALAKRMLLDLHAEFQEQMETTDEFIFLEDLVIFVSASYPDFCQQAQPEITNAFFCAYAIQAAKINESFTAHPSYIYEALHTDSPYVFCRTVEAGLIIALRNSDYQAAYDLLYPVFHMKMVGEYKDIPRKFSSSDLRKPEINFDFALHKSIMSLHCSGMADLQSRGSVQYHAFRKKAIRYAKDVLRSEEISYDIFRDCVLSLLNSGSYKDAAKASVDMLSRHEKTNPLPKARLSSIYVDVILSYLGLICSRNQVFDSKWKPLKKTIADLWGIDLDFWKHYTKIDESEFRSVLCICGRTKVLSLSKRTDIAGLLMCAYHLVQKIKRELWDDSYIQTVYDTREEHPNDSPGTTTTEEKQPLSIAYYTTLNNLKYLWEPVYANSYLDRPKPRKDFAEEKDLPKGKNCLTMMHAHYMNDPREGIALPDALSDWIDQKSSCKNILFRNNSPEAFRERLFDNQFVFLKSFTDIIDQLNMWSMYGSDRSDGSDSNGCCVRIDPKTFENMLSISHKTAILTDMDKNHDTDDLRLYKIAYLKDNELVAPKSDDLEHYFEQLKKMVQKLNDLLASDKSCTEEDVKVITQLLQEILTPIVFLFKDASYRAEHERRLIVTRSRTKADMERISKTPQDPPKLYVNPFHQVFVNQIILGPKVKQPDNWIPHLQFELTKMWEKWPEEKYGKRVPSVRKSSINYRD